MVTQRDLVDEKLFYEYLFPKYEALFSKVGKVENLEDIQKKKDKEKKIRWFRREEGFELYFDFLGIDSEKWVRIFKENLGIVNKNGIQKLNPKHYEKIKKFVIKDTPEEDIVRKIFGIQEDNNFKPHNLVEDEVETPDIWN